MNEKYKHLIATTSITLRKIVLLLIKLFPIDIKIRNPYTGKHILINFYRHKSYWYYGASREYNIVQSLRKLINKGNIVIDVGGHIGFLSHLYSNLVGPEGKVLVFEPGENNLPYTRFNLKSLSNTKLFEKGCSDFNGKANFYIDGLTGQNNSLLHNYEVVETVAKSHFESAVRINKSIQVLKLCDFIENLNILPDHVKIDVEGSELAVLKGLGRFLGLIPSLMVEIRHNSKDIYTLMESSGYCVLDDKLRQTKLKDKIGKVNVFFLLKNNEIIKKKSNY